MANKNVQFDDIITRNEFLNLVYKDGFQIVSARKDPYITSDGASPTGVLYNTPVFVFSKKQSVSKFTVDRAFKGLADLFQVPEKTKIVFWKGWEEDYDTFDRDKWKSSNIENPDELTLAENLAVKCAYSTLQRAKNAIIYFVDYDSETDFAQFQDITYLQDDIVEVFNQKKRP